MKELQVKDKKFAVSIPEAELQKEIRRVAAETTKDMQGNLCPC